MAVALIGDVVRNFGLEAVQTLCDDDVGHAADGGRHTGDTHLPLEDVAAELVGEAAEQLVKEAARGAGAWVRDRVEDR